MADSNLTCPICHGPVGADGWCPRDDAGNAPHDVPVREPQPAPGQPAGTNPRVVGP